MKYYIKGDGSYLCIIDVNTYKCHVGPNWANNPKLLEPHFVEQMQEYSGLFWDTNLETSWLVEVQTEKIDISFESINDLYIPLFTEFGIVDIFIGTELVHLVFHFKNEKFKRENIPIIRKHFNY